MLGFRVSEKVISSFLETEHFHHLGFVISSSYSVILVPKPKQKCLLCLLARFFRTVSSYLVWEYTCEISDAAWVFYLTHLEAPTTLQIYKHIFWGALLFPYCLRRRLFCGLFVTTFFELCCRIVIVFRSKFESPFQNPFFLHCFTALLYICLFQHLEVDVTTNFFRSVRGTYSI